MVRACRQQEGKEVGGLAGRPDHASRSDETVTGAGVEYGKAADGCGACGKGVPQRFHPARVSYERRTGRRLTLGLGFVKCRMQGKGKTSVLEEAGVAGVGEGFGGTPRGQSEAGV